MDIRGSTDLDPVTLRLEPPDIMDVGRPKADDDVG
jgi:hypothetical protein